MGNLFLKVPPLLGTDEEPDAAFPESGRVGSYGQLVRQGVTVPGEIKSGAPGPGYYCNGHYFPCPKPQNYPTQAGNLQEALDGNPA